LDIWNYWLYYIYFNRFGTWGICFIYGTLYAVKGLVAAGRTYDNCSFIQKACTFLLSKQLCTGGWGESYMSTETKVHNYCFSDIPMFFDSQTHTSIVYLCIKERRDKDLVHAHVLHLGETKIKTMVQTNLHVALDHRLMACGLFFCIHATLSSP
jgi:hypothetical protein